MTQRITNYQKQDHPQSCTALAIKCALHEFDIIKYDGLKGGELKLWNKLKRSNSKGEEDIMPHSAVSYLLKKGCKVEIIENKTKSAPLVQLANKEYSEYQQGLTQENLKPTNRPLDVIKDFENDARIFMIVGFLNQGKFSTHTLLCRKDANSYWVLNPDGGTDTSYTYSEFDAFLKHNNPQVQSPNFGSKTNYIFTGICFRVTL